MTVPPHEWLRALRIGKDLRQSDVEQRTAQLDGRIRTGVVSKLENGRTRPSTLRPSQITALRRVLDITKQEWNTHTGGQAEAELERWT